MSTGADEDNASVQHAGSALSGRSSGQSEMHPSVDVQCPDANVQIRSDGSINMIPHPIIHARGSEPRRPDSSLQSDGSVNNAPHPFIYARGSEPRRSAMDQIEA